MKNRVIEGKMGFYKAHRTIILLGVMILLAGIMAYFVYGLIYVTDAHGHAFTRDLGASENMFGVVITPTYNITIYNVTKSTGDEHTTACVRLLGGQPLGCQAFTGNVANFSSPVKVYNNQSYLVTVSQGLVKPNGTGDGTVSFPVVGTNLNWIGNVYANSTTTTGATEIYSIVSITSSSSTDGILTTLVSPTTGTLTSASSINFTTQHSPTGSVELQNATYNIWYNNGTIYNQTTVIVKGDVANYTNLNVSFVSGDYKWNVYGCGNYSTTDYCSWAAANYTFSVVNFNVDAESYSSSTIEGSSEFFQINITVNAGTQLSTAKLLYNGTLYSTGTFIDLGAGKYSISKTLDIPNIAVSPTIYSFLWELKTTDGFSSNSSMHNQSVSEISVDDCSVFTTLLLNYSLKDEATQIPINGTIFNASVEVNMQLYPIGSNIAIVNYSNNFSKNNNPRICFATPINNSQYRMYAEAKYVADSYVPKYNYIQNFTLVNSSLPQNINLFDLLSADSTEFLITYKDANFLAVPNAIISIQRKYVAENLYKKVEDVKTDNYGQGKGHFDTDGVLYSIIVYKEGQILSTFNNVVPYCENKLSGICNINIDASSQFVSYPNFYTYNNFAFTSVFNMTTRIYTLNFATLDGSVASVGINLTKNDNYGNNTFCTNFIVTSSGSLTCTVPTALNNLTFTVDIYKDGKIIQQELYSIATKGNDFFAGNLVIFMIGIVLFFGLAFIPSPIMTVVGTIIGASIGSALFFLTGARILGTSMIFIAILGGIIIFLMRQRGAD